jgi:hypothetical protein
MCERQETKKYTSRKSPPYPANECKGTEKEGNDGKMYISVGNKNGVHRWVLKESKSKSPKKSSIKITKCMKDYIDLDEDPGTWKTASDEVLEIARDFCKDESDAKHIAKYQKTFGSKKSKSPKGVCKADQILNPATGRCVLKTGAIGKKLLGK